jgi:hypothetical protein
LSIENVLNKNVEDTIVAAKTGEGNSLIFQVANCMLNTKQYYMSVSLLCVFVLFSANGAGAQKNK